VQILQPDQRRPWLPLILSISPGKCPHDFVKIPRKWGAPACCLTSELDPTGGITCACSVGLCILAVTFSETPIILSKFAKSSKQYVGLATAFLMGSCLPTLWWVSTGRIILTLSTVPCLSMPAVSILISLDQFQQGCRNLLCPASQSWFSRLDPFKDKSRSSLGTRSNLTEGLRSTIFGFMIDLEDRFRISGQVAGSCVIPFVLPAERWICAVCPFVYPSRISPHSVRKNYINQNEDTTLTLIYIILVLVLSMSPLCHNERHPHIIEGGTVLASCPALGQTMEGSRRFLS